jgi:hypothetical protein
VKSRNKVAHEVMHSTGRLSSQKSGDLLITRGVGGDVVHLQPNTRVGVAIVFCNGWLEVLGVSDRPKMS